jgi:hypothetical protein
VLPPVGAKLIAGIGQAVTSMPADEMMIGTGAAVTSQIPATGAGGAALRDTQRRHVILGIGGLGLPELNQPVQSLQDVHFPSLIVNVS